MDFLSTALALAIIVIIVVTLFIFDNLNRKYKLLLKGIQERSDIKERELKEIIETYKSRNFVLSQDYSKIFDFLSSLEDKIIDRNFETKVKKRIIADDKLVYINDEMFIGYVTETSTEVLSILSDNIKESLKKYLKEEEINSYVTKEVYAKFLKITSSLNKMIVKRNKTSSSAISKYNSSSFIKNKNITDSFKEEKIKKEP